MGAFFDYDNPTVLETQIEDELNIKPTQWALFFTLYSIPNVILPLFGGIFLDKIGVRLGLLIFSFVVVIGQTLFMIGGYNKSYSLMLLGRIVFGLGGENTNVA